MGCTVYFGQTDGSILSVFLFLVLILALQRMARRWHVHLVCSRFSRHISCTSVGANCGSR